MKDRLPGPHRLCLFAIRRGGVHIPIETRKIAARYFEPNAMPRCEYIARHAHIHADLVRLILFDENRLVER